MTPRETENNAYAKFWGDKGGALWYSCTLWYFLEWSIMLVQWNLNIPRSPGYSE